MMMLLFIISNYNAGGMQAVHIEKRGENTCSEFHTDPWSPWGHSESVAQGNEAQVDSSRLFKQRKQIRVQARGGSLDL